MSCLLAVSFFAGIASAAPPALMLNVDRGTETVAGKGGEVRSMTLGINLRSAATNEVKLKLEWYFVASPIGAFGYYISDRGSQDMKLGPMKVVNVRKSTPMILLKDVPLKGGKTAQMKVSEAKGFIVRVLAGGKVIATKAEPSFIARKIEDPEEFKALLSAAPPKVP